jgi:uroporphyrin-III C-methyltransferase
MPESGRVVLIGAGPGDPDLITVRGAKLMALADVVLYDELATADLLDLAPERAQRINVGKRGHDVPTRSQEEINALLVEHARAGRTVVRLKGGDPFVFGRGGEEAAALRAEGLDVRVVPGISSSIAAPAAAGIPVTMRGMASGVTIVTAHQGPANERSLDWAALARSGTTLVVLMGAALAATLSSRLRDGGMRPDMPVAVITRATCVDECIRRMTLAELGREPVENPSTIVIGEVAAHDVLRDVPELAVIAADPTGASS